MKNITLRTAGLVFIAGFVVHNGDHARRGLDAIREGVVWAGTLVGLLAAVVLTLVFTGHRRAPAAAAAVGPAIALGVSASHLLPDWGALSDPLAEGDVDWFTWVAVASEIGAAALLGWVGFTIVRRHRFALDVPVNDWSPPPHHQELGV